MSLSQLYIRTFLIVLISLLLQGALVHAVAPAGVGVNLLVAVVVFLAFHEPTARGAILCFLIGIVFDIQGARVLGPWGTGFVLVFGLLSGMAQRIFVESTFTIIVLVFSGTLISSIVALLLGFDWSRIAVSGIFGSLAVESLLTACVAPFIFSVLRRVYRHRSGSASRGVV